MPGAIIMLSLSAEDTVMAQVLIRNIPSEVLDGLKARAQQSKRSLQGEVRVILEEAAKPSSRRNLAAFLKHAKALRRKTSGAKQTDSALLLREDRER
jgi:plasmid stability protein